jgi:hypothetical protein
VADLSRDHLLAMNSAVVAVIDFGDVWGDGDYHFHCLVLDFGESFAKEVVRRYGHPNLDRLVSKLHYAMADLIGTILEEPARTLPGQVDEAWRRLKQFDLLY